MVSVSAGSLGSSICTTVKEAFLDGPLRSGLSSLDEDTRSLYLALAAKIVTSVSAPMLVNGGLWHTSFSCCSICGHLLYV